jgi:hypothetical protein
VNGAFSYYASTILVYLGVDILAVWSLNLQYGVTGIYNFAWILFQAVGAYTAGVLTLGPASGNGGFQQYILGLRLPEPLPVLLAGVVAGMLALVVGIVALRRLRTDYQAMVMLVISVIAVLVVENVTGLFNGPAGLSLVPQPFSSLPLSSLGYQWFYVALTAAVCLIVTARQGAAGDQGQRGRGAGTGQGRRAAAPVRVRLRRRDRRDQRGGPHSVHRGLVTRIVGLRGNTCRADRDRCRRHRQQRGSDARCAAGAGRLQ